MYNKEQIEKNVKSILTLEWLGVRIEDTKEEKDPYGLFGKTAYYYSVPESSTIEIEGEDRVKTADGLKLLTKEVLKELLVDTCKDSYGHDEDFIKEIEDNFSNYFKCYAKVRKGEIWSRELGEKRIKELTEEIEKVAGYREV